MARISSEQAFENAVGFSMSTFSGLIIMIVSASIFLWSAWIALSVYKDWISNSGATPMDVAWSILRAVFVLCLVLFITY